MIRFHGLRCPVRFLFVLGLLLIISQTGCTPGKTSSSALSSQYQVQQQQEAVRPSKVNFGSIAVIGVNIKHPTARLVYKEQNVRDRITRGLQKSKGFRVIDWSRLEDVLFRRNLESSDLVTDVALRKEIGDLLLNDYFLHATISSFGERMEYSSSAFSKQKTQVVDVQLELFVKNALTNEIIASANGHGVTRKVITQTLGFGAAGGNDTVAANRALDMAVDEAVNKLLVAMQDVPKPERKAASAQNSAVAGKVHRQPKVKVLFILSETEERKNTEIVKNTSVDKFTSSTVEQAMAKVFSDAGYQVLTADDVLGKAYGVSGDENILLSGWINEQDIEEFENLLQARSGLASYAVKVGKLAHADIVISGAVKYELGDVSGPGNIRAKTNSVVLTAKALLVKAKKTYHVAIVEKNFMAVLNPSTMKARESALIKAASEAAQDMLRHTPIVNK